MQAKTLTELRGDWEHLERQLPGAPERTIQWVRWRLNNYIETKRIEFVAQSELDAINGKSETTIKALAVAKAEKAAALAAAKNAKAIAALVPPVPALAVPRATAGLVQICYDFRDKGSCERGSDCKWSHKKSDIDL